ncbi:hypothetical protein BH11BAC7_BH11BAC7_12780 [soil metagenome]
MKKLFFGLGTAMLLSSAQLPAQIIFQNYYQWVNPQHVDHGPFNKVKTWKSGNTPFYFIVGGATDPSGNFDAPTFSCINGATGSTVFSELIAQPFFGPPITFEAVSLAIGTLPSNPSIAVLCNHLNSSGINQVLLYEFDVSGTVLAATNLGPGKGIDVVFNPQGNAFDVLCEVNGTNGTDYEFTGVDAYSFFTSWSKTYNWGALDKPTSLAIDNGDIVAGGYTEVGADRQILMIRTDVMGNIIWGQAFGLPNRRETITDIVFYYNTDGFFRYGFCGWDETTDQALVGDVAISGPQSGYTERYIATVNGQHFRKTHATAIARSDNNVFICGAYEDNSPFIATFLKNNNLTPQNFDFFDDSETIPEGLNDITCELGTTARVVSVGFQQRNVAWGTSPANQNYSWIMTMSQLGTANCKISANAVTTLSSGTDPFQIVSTAAGISRGAFSGAITKTNFNSLDNCVNPARFGAEEETIEQAKVTDRFSALYPNPGNGTFYIDGAVAETENAIISITDLQGRAVASQQLVPGATRQTIELGNLANGIYYWSVLLNGEILRSDKLIIAH